MLRFKTGEPVNDVALTATAVTDNNSDFAGPFIAVRHRAAGSSSVYFGPFATIEELCAWCDENRLSAGIISLIDPSSDPSTWWTR